MKFARISLALALVIFLGVFLLIHRSASAMSGTMCIAFPENLVKGPSYSAITIRHENGETVTRQASPWPEGVLDLVNHPLRTHGWNHFFSSSPNDVDEFDFNLRYVRDMEHVVRTFTAIKSDSLRLELYLQNDKPPLIPKTIAAQFQIGNQAIVDSWFSSLPADENGARIFGVHRLTEPWPACPPTLSLYVGHEAVDLNRLNIPPRVEVDAVVWDEYRARHKEDPALKALDEFVASHKAKQKADRKRVPEKK